MSSDLDGRVAIVTGAGRGLGRAHALLLSGLGARVVVNDPGGATDGSGSDTSVAKSVVDEIRALGGQAIANTDSVSDWVGAQRLIGTAVDEFGRLDVLVNNAGILRDRMLVNMSEAEFDAVVDVHLKGTFCTTRHAAAYWRDRAKDGGPTDGAVINTSSGAGLFNNVGQANYAAAKAAIATFSQVAAKELRRYGVRVNTIAPMARTRLVQQSPGFGELTRERDDVDFDPWAPENVSPLVAYLASPRCSFTGGIWHVFGGRIDIVGGYRFRHTVARDTAWTAADLADELDGLPADFVPSDVLSEEFGLDRLVQDLTAELAGNHT
jgi:NAD(P)-dependent dehydrogenase (short-subunit alcohol dehydrogenase family)